MGLLLVNHVQQGLSVVTQRSIQHLVKQVSTVYHHSHIVYDVPMAHILYKMSQPLVKFVQQAVIVRTHHLYQFVVQLDFTVLQEACTVYNALQAINVLTQLFHLYCAWLVRMLVMLVYSVYCALGAHTALRMVLLYITHVNPVTSLTTLNLLNVQFALQGIVVLIFLLHLTYALRVVPALREQLHVLNVLRAFMPMCRDYQSVFHALKVTNVVIHMAHHNNALLAVTVSICPRHVSFVLQGLSVLVQSSIHLVVLPVHFLIMAQMSVQVALRGFTVLQTS